MTPRSFCPECGVTVAWYDNVPVLSYLVLRGKCRSCAQAIGWRYPAVEMATSLLWGLIAFRYGWSLAAAKWILFECCLVVLFWTDFEEQILPDEVLFVGGAGGLILALFVPLHGTFVDFFLARQTVLLRSLVNAVSSAAVFSLPTWAVAAIYEKVRAADAFGLGDVKLLAFLGLFLGFDAGLAAVVIGTVSGAVFGVAYVLVTRQDWRTASLPFGTFLCLGAAAVPLFGRV